VAPTGSSRTGSLPALGFPRGNRRREVRRHGKLTGLEEHPKDAIDKIRRHWAGELSGLTPER